jgi:putative two-component system response regulator
MERVRVLVVSRSVEEMKLVRAAIAEASTEVRMVIDLQAALELLANWDADVVLAEVPPDEGVTERIGIILRCAPAARVVPIADPPLQETRLEAMVKAGAFDCLVRPLTTTVVRFALQRAESSWSLATALESQSFDVQDAPSHQVFEALSAAVFGFAKLVEYRDADTAFHLERLADLSGLVASELARHPRYARIINAAYVEHLKLSSVLHDVGKVGVPDLILSKPGPLTREEYEIIKFHTLIGYEAIKEIQDKLGPKRFFHMAMMIARHHHERWDGTGYPEKLAGEAIPLSARLVSIADSYDAMTNERPYRAPMPHEEALEVIRGGRGTQFDPELVDALVRVEGALREHSLAWSSRGRGQPDSVQDVFQAVRSRTSGAMPAVRQPQPREGVVDPGGAGRTRTMVAPLGSEPGGDWDADGKS